MRLGLVQFNPTVGALIANTEATRGWIARAADAGVDLLVFPELSLTGYPPRDLLLQEGFIEDVRRCAERLAERVTGAMTVLIGAPWRVEGRGAPAGAALTNSVLVLRDGRIAARYDKRLLPSYDVFDEERYFVPGDAALVIDCAGVRVGLSVCEDLWKGMDVGADHRYAQRADPVQALIEAGATLIVNPSASPFALGKGRRQREVVTRHARAHGVAIATVNQVGGNDDLIFSGHAAVFVPDPPEGGPGGGCSGGDCSGGSGSGGGSARLVAAGPGFQEALVTLDLSSDPREWRSLPAVADPLLSAPDERSLWEALVLGVGDYCRKTGFASCVLGLSGGIDSALTACIARAALGAERVLTVGMPSRYSSEGSVTDAQALALALGVRFHLIPIAQPHSAFEAVLHKEFRALGCDPAPGVTEENVQSRIRGTLLMALSNKTGAILLTTGNKSELAVGYCTLYGDMNGGLAVLSDVTKQQVYALSRWINANPRVCGCDGPPIPEATLTKPPSAELRPDQTDQDTLPPYEALDRVIEAYVERRWPPARIARETGIDGATVARVVRMIDGAEYKRKQMPVGLKVTGLTFGPGRRWPIAQGYRPSE